MENAGTPHFDSNPETDLAALFFSSHEITATTMYNMALEKKLNSYESLLEAIHKRASEGKTKLYNVDLDLCHPLWGSKPLPEQIVDRLKEKGFRYVIRKKGWSICWDKKL